jgi:hypothetical protein
MPSSMSVGGSEHTISEAWQTARAKTCVGFRFALDLPRALRAYVTTIIYNVTLCSVSSTMPTSVCVHVSLSVRVMWHVHSALHMALHRPWEVCRVWGLQSLGGARARLTRVCVPMSMCLWNLPAEA